MNLSAITQAISQPGSGLPLRTATSANNSSDGSSFAGVVKDALGSLEQSQAGAEKEIAKAVTGDSTDLHRTIVSLQSADLNFQLGLQVRNKLVGAYEEIMKMQV